MAAEAKNSIKASNKIARDTEDNKAAAAAPVAKAKDKKDYNDEEKVRDAVAAAVKAKGNNKEVFTTLCSVSCGGHSLKTAADLTKGLTDKNGLGMTLSAAQQALVASAFAKFASKDGLNLAAFVKFQTI